MLSIEEIRSRLHLDWFIWSNLNRSHFTLAGKDQEMDFYSVESLCDHCCRENLLIDTKYGSDYEIINEA